MSTSAIAMDEFEVFGTTAVLLVTDPRALIRARAIADEVLADVDLACSRFRPDSELARLNAAGGKPIAISATFAELLAAALRAARLTGGDVNPTCGRALTGLGYDRDFADIKAAGDAAPRLTGSVGPLPGWGNVHLDSEGRRAWLDHGVQIDLGATAKAWASDRCAEQMADRLGCGVLVSSRRRCGSSRPAPARQLADQGHRRSRGADIGCGADGNDQLRRPGDIQYNGPGLDRRRQAGSSHHRPGTGEPARSCWRTVSVAAGNCTDANTASTAAIVRSAAAIDWLHNLGLPARLVRHDGSVETTAGWPTDVPGDAA